MTEPRTRQPAASAGRIVYRKVPEPVRREIDQAIADRPDGRKTLADIYRHFRLKEEHGVGISSFRQYARRVENIKRKESIGRITSGLCRQPDTEDQAALQRRGHLLLVQRIIRTLEDGELSTSELARIAQAFTAQGKLRLEIEKRRPQEQKDDPHKPKKAPAEIPARIAEWVREIYGAHVPKEQAADPEPAPRVAKSE